MNLTSPSQVKAWCIENGFHPNKVLGQNFLIDRNALVSIVDAGLAGCSDAHDADVLEIGPGLGVLTEELLNRGCTVTAIEKDPVLAARLAESLGNPPKLRVVEADALDWIAGTRIDPDCNDYGGVVPQFDAMVSNLPYQAGTRILLELVQRREIPSMTVLVQTEVAERLARRRVGSARLRRQDRPKSRGELFLAAPRNRIFGCHARQARQKCCTFRQRTRYFSPFD